jgi:hypothetical protein
LDLIGKGLEEDGHSFTRIDGSMNSSKRIEAVGSFCSEEEDTPRFILCSLHAAGTFVDTSNKDVAIPLQTWIILKPLFVLCRNWYQSHPRQPCLYDGLLVEPGGRESSQ